MIFNDLQWVTNNETLEGSHDTLYNFVVRIAWVLILFFYQIQQVYRITREKFIHLELIETCWQIMKFKKYVLNIKNDNTRYLDWYWMVTMVLIHWNNIRIKFQDTKIHFISIAKKKTTRIKIFEKICFPQKVPPPPELDVQLFFGISRDLIQQLGEGIQLPLCSFSYFPKGLVLL